MAEPAYGTATGTEISEKTRDLVLPSIAMSELPVQTETRSISDVSDTSDVQERKVGLNDPSVPSSRAMNPSPQSADPDSGAAQATLPKVQRGLALPGDRGPRAQPAEGQRPSFWRRIALGGRRPVESEVTPVITKAATAPGIEQRIVEPLLQSLVSIEAKLERSHVDLTQRSDQVEQRLTQLWDIEEQLGTLVELQESLQHVSEQQRRLASAVESQTHTLRWLVASIFFSLAAAAFVVAAVLR